MGIADSCWLALGSDNARSAFSMIRVLEKMVSALSVTPVCPRCKQVIPSEDVNVANDIAFCRKCNLSHSLSSLTLGTAIDENVDVHNPPAGAWFRQEGVITIVGATHRSLGQAMTLLLVSLFWNGIVSVFVMFAAASTLQHLGVSVPHWFPTAASKGHPMPLALTIGLWLFLTPFIAVGLAMLGTFLSSLGGRTEFRIQGRECVLFTGIGGVGFRKRFSPEDVKDVRLEDKRWRDSDGDARRNAQIIIETNGKPIKLGSMLSDERRRFVAAAIRKQFVRAP